MVFSLQCVCLSVCVYLCVCVISDETLPVRAKLNETRVCVLRGEEGGVLSRGYFRSVESVEVTLSSTAHQR